MDTLAAQNKQAR